MEKDVTVEDAGQDSRQTIVFDGEFAKYPEELFRIAFEVAESIHLPNVTSGKGGVDVPPDLLRGRRQKTRVRIVEAPNVHLREDGAITTDPDCLVGYVSIQPKSDGGGRVTIEQLDEAKPTLRPIFTDASGTTYVREQPTPSESAASIEIISAEGFDRALWFENFTYLFLLQADGTRRADEWLRERGNTDEFIKKVRWENGHLQLLDGYTMERYLADREKSIARQQARMKQSVEEAVTVFIGRCKDAERVIELVEAFVTKHLPPHVEGAEPPLHSGSFKLFYDGAPKQYEIRATMRGVGEWAFGHLEISPASDTEYDFELVCYGNDAPDWVGFDYQAVREFFVELAEKLRKDYPELRKGQRRGLVETSANADANELSGVISLSKSPKFFITHSWDDIELARRLTDDLRAKGLDGFFDAYSIKPGDMIPSEIARGLEACDVYLPILSYAALKSSWCEEEINAAIMLSKESGRNGRPRIIPALVENCQDAMPIFLRTRLYLNFAGRYDDALRELLTAGFGLQVHELPPSPTEADAPKPTLGPQFLVQPATVSRSETPAPSHLPVGSKLVVDAWEIAVTKVDFAATLSGSGRIEKARGRFAVIFMDVTNRGFSQAGFVAFGRVVVKDASGQVYDENPVATALAQSQFKTDLGARINPDDTANVMAVFDVSTASDFYTLSPGILAKNSNGDLLLPIK